MNCPKCGFLLDPGQQSPTGECPSCGVIFAKATERPKTRVVSKNTGIGGQVITVALALLVFCGWQMYQWLQERSAITEAQRIEALPPKYGQWAEGLNVSVIRTMGKNGFDGNWGGCGVIRYRVDLVHDGRFLVRCSPTGQNWSEYVVDTRKSTVSGPYMPQPENN